MKVVVVVVVVVVVIIIVVVVVVAVVVVVDVVVVIPKQIVHLLHVRQDIVSSDRSSLCHHALRYI